MRQPTFKPCPICGAVEHLVEGTDRYEITHDMDKHFGPVPERKRMTTEELLQIPDGSVFDAITSRRTA